MSQKSFRFWKDCGVARTGFMNIVNFCSQSELQDGEDSQVSSKKEDLISGSDDLDDINDRCCSVRLTLCITACPFNPHVQEDL